MTLCFRSKCPFLFKRDFFLFKRDFFFRIEKDSKEFSTYDLRNEAYSQLLLLYYLEKEKAILLIPIKSDNFSSPSIQKGSFTLEVLKLFYM